MYRGEYVGAYIAEADEVSASRRDKVLAAEESKGSTEHANDLILQAKVRRRTVVARTQRAKKLGKKIPEALLASASVAGVPNIAAQMEKMLKLVEAK